MMETCLPGQYEWRLGANSGHSPTVWRTDQIDPLLPFKFVPMKGRNAQEAVVRRRLGERVISDPLLPSRSLRYVKRAPISGPIWRRQKSSPMGRPA